MRTMSGGGGEGVESHATLPRRGLSFVLCAHPALARQPLSCHLSYQREKSYVLITVLSYCYC